MPSVSEITSGPLRTRRSAIRPGEARLCRRRSVELDALRRSPWPILHGGSTEPDPVAGARDVAIVLVLGDAGLRCEVLAHLQRRDFLAARQGARLRTLDVRHGKGDRQRRVKLSVRAAAAIVRWDGKRAAALGEVDALARCSSRWARGRCDGTYTRSGGRCGQRVLGDLLGRLGAAAQQDDVDLPGHGRGPPRGDRRVPRARRRGDPRRRSRRGLTRFFERTRYRPLSGQRQPARRARLQSAPPTEPPPTPLGGFAAITSGQSRDRDQY